MKYRVMKSRGFTLIELLVVIALIGILSTVLLVNLSGIRERNRDTKRKADIKEIQTALELYRADAGVYPASITCDQPLQNPSTNIVYKEKIPCDPSGGSWRYIYAPNTANLRYTLSACLENTNDKDIFAGSTSCDSNPARREYRVTNP